MPWKLENFKGKPQFNYAEDWKKGEPDREKKKKQEDFLKKLEQARAEASKAEEEARKANSGVKMSLNRLLGLSKSPEPAQPKITIDEKKIKSLPGPQNYGKAQFLSPEPDLVQQMNAENQQKPTYSLRDFKRDNPNGLEFAKPKEWVGAVKKGTQEFLTGITQEDKKKMDELDMQYDKVRSQFTSGQIDEKSFKEKADKILNEKLSFSGKAASNVLLNVTPLGAGKGLVRSELKELAKTSDPQFVQSFLKGRVPDEALPRVAETVAKMRKPEEINSFLKTLDTTVPQTTRLDEVLPSATKVPEAPAQRPSLSRFLGRNTQEQGIPLQQASQGNIELPVYKNPQALEKMSDDEVLDIGKSVLKEGEQNPEKAPLFDRVKVALENKFVNAQRYLQDREVSMKRLIEGKTNGPVTVTDEANVAQKLELLPGRVDVRLREIESETESIIRDTTETAKKLNVSAETLQKDIDKYLIARHAPERNAVHGDGAAGMKTDEAKRVVQEMEQRADGKEIKRIAEGILAMNKVTLDLLLDGGVIGEKIYAKLRNAYPNHVPLNRVMEGDDILEQFGMSAGKTMSVPSTGILKAKGSSKEVSDILGNVQTMVAQAIVRVEKNRVMNSLLSFAESNPQLVGKNGIFTVGKRKATGFRFDGKTPIFEDLKENQFVVRLGDDAKVITINDPQIATVMSGVGVQELPPILKWVSAYTRLKAGLATRFNVEFAPSNIIRDTQELAVYLSAQKEIGAKGAGRATKNIPSAMKGVVDSYRGVDSEWSKLYKEMKMDGGTTGGMALSTRGDIGLNIEKLRSLQGSNFKKSVRYVFEKIDDWNTIFEDSTRLAAYETALKSGMTRDQAAYIAKNATINFNKHGNAGPVLNGLYMFANASIQGSAKMLKAMKNPKVLGTVALSVGATTAAVNRMNDAVDPEWRTKVTPWDRASNIIIAIPSEEGIKYVTIPISWGLRPLKVMADAVDDFTTGHNKGGIGGFVKDFGTAVLEGYNPVGGSDLAQSVTPTIGDMPLDIARNKSWSGGLVRPDWMKLKAPEEQYFSTTPNSQSGRVAIGAAGLLADLSGDVIRISPEDIKYAVTDLIGGPGRTLTRLWDTGASVVSGGVPSAQDIPFSNRFFKNKSGEDLERLQTSNENRGFFEKLQGYEDGSPEQKDFIRERLLSLPDDEARKKLLLKLSSGGVDTKNLRSSEAMLKMEGTYQQIQDLLASGKADDAKRVLNELPKEKQDTYFDIRKSERAKRTTEFNKLLQKNPKEAVAFVRSQSQEEQQRLLKTLSNEEYALYNQGK